MKSGVKDIWNSERAYKNSRHDNLKSLYKKDRELIIKFLDDMQTGINTSKVKKGKRSYARLNTLKSRIPMIFGWIKDKYKKSGTDIDYREIAGIFDDVNTGKITKKSGNPYKSSDDYIKDFRSFWNWYIKMMRKDHNTTIPNIMEDIEDSGIKIKPWVYFEDRYDEIKNNAKYEYRIYFDLLMDIACRTGKELFNIRVGDVEEIKEDPSKANITIREETSKTFGRTFKLMFSYPELKKFIEKKALKKDDFIVQLHPVVFDRYLKRLFARTFKNDELTKAGKRYSQIRLYDFRHNGACYWLRRYKTQTGLMYRMGWKNTRMIEYYTQFLGLKDTITDDDMLSDVTKTKLEKELELEQQKRQLLEEEIVKIKENQEGFMDAFTDMLMDSYNGDPDKMPPKIRAFLINK